MWNEFKTLAPAVQIGFAAFISLIAGMVIYLTYLLLRKDLEHTQKLNEKPLDVKSDCKSDFRSMGIPPLNANPDDDLLLIHCPKSLNGYVCTRELGHSGPCAAVMPEPLNPFASLEYKHAVEAIRKANYELYKDYASNCTSNRVYCMPYEEWAISKGKPK